MNWTIPVYIPYLDKVVKYHPYTNRNQEHIIKYCGSEDKIGLLQYFKQMLRELCVSDSIEPDNLPVVDQVMMLLRLRSMCSGHEVKLMIPDSDQPEKKPEPPPPVDDEPPPITRSDEPVEQDKPKGITYNVSLLSLQKTIHENYQPPVTIGDSNAIQVKVHYPFNWSTVDFQDYISSISVNNNTVTNNKKNKHEIMQLIEHLPVDILNDIKKAQQIYEKSVQNMIFIETIDNSPNIYMDHEYFLDMLITIYNEEFPNFIELMYVFVKMMHMPLTDVMSLTPVDTQMYYKAFEKENEEREKARKKNN